MMDYITYDLPPGPAILPQRWYINFHKGGVGIYLFMMMIYYDNWSLGAWLYLAMHGSYGIMWLFKDFIFRDEAFSRPCTVVSFFMPWPVALAPYLLPGYWMMSR